MASTLKVDQIETPSGVGNISFAQPLSGDGSQLTGVGLVVGGGAVTAGDFLYHDGTEWTRLPKGTASQYLRMNAGATAPEWIATSGAGVQVPASSAAGDILYYDGTNYVRLAKGTAAQTLAMNSGATAPEWADAAGGAWTAKSSGTLTTASTLEVTGITGTTMIFLNLEQSAATDSILMRTSSDGGTTYDSGASDYYRNNWDLLQSESTPAYNKSDFASFLLHGARGSSSPAGDHMAMAVRIIRPQDSFAQTHFLSDYTGTANVGGGSEGFHGHSGGFRKSAGIVNAIKIFSSSGGTMSGGYEIIHL